MSFQEFTGLCDTLMVGRGEIENAYQQKNLDAPFCSDDANYDQSLRELVAQSVFEGIFGKDGDLDLEDLSLRIKKNRQAMVNSKKHKDRSPVWSTVDNISVAAAKAAAEESRIQMDSVLVNPPEIDLIECSRAMKIPYAPVRTELLKGYGSVDEVALYIMYKENIVAMLIARHYDFEQLLPPKPISEYVAMLPPAKTRPHERSA
jgi:hypothetical protein